MNDNIYNIDMVSLRKDLCDYFGIAMTNVSYFAISELTRVENATYEELIKIAIENNFNLDDYMVKSDGLYR